MPRGLHTTAAQFSHCCACSSEQNVSGKPVAHNTGRADFGGQSVKLPTSRCEISMSVDDNVPEEKLCSSSMAFTTFSCAQMRRRIISLPSTKKCKLASFEVHHKLSTNSW